MAYLIWIQRSINDIHWGSENIKKKKKIEPSYVYLFMQK